MAARERRAGASDEPKRKHRRSERSEPVASDPSEPAAPKEEGFLFDPYWDDVFAAYFDPTLRVCCLLKY
jgi:hypothetical protein